MSEELVFRVVREGLLLVLLLSGVPMLAAMFIGFVVGIFQATTQIQEHTLSFVPKLVTIFLTLAVMAPWMISQAVRFATVLFESIPMLR